MARIYYLALVDKEDTSFSGAFARHDAHVASFSVTQDEAGFAGLTVTIEKPDLSLLDPERPQWAWLSMLDGSDLVPLFHGRIVAIPSNVQLDTVTLEFTARPVDYENQKQAVAAGLRSAPFFDYAFIDPQMWEDAETTLDARTDAWHIDRLTNEVTISSIIEGEDGTLDITSDLIPFDGFDLSFGEAPLHRVDLQMRAMWTQQIAGSVDITAAMLAAFEAAGSPAGFATSFTGAGLYNSWPMEGDSQSNVYKFGPQTITVADGILIKRKYKSVKVKYETAPTGDSSQTVVENRKVDFRRWAFKISSIVNYAAGIERTEDISFSVYADVQSVTSEQNDAQAEIITLSSGSIGTPVGEGSAQETPVGDLSRDSYFPTERGQLSIQFGLAHARALLLRRARAAEITVKVPLATAVAATCRKSATVYHPSLPGGAATGKIVHYQFGVDGSSGAEGGEITIACLAGRASSFPTITGTPTYGSADYMGPDYQVFEGRAVVADVTDMRYTVPDALGVQPAVIGLTSVTVINGETAQREVMSRKFIDVNAAADGVNNVHTKVDLRMTPLDTSPRAARYADTDVDLPVPKGIDLGEST